MRYETKRKLDAIIMPEKCPYCGDAVPPLRIACKKCFKTLPHRRFNKQINDGCRTVSAVPYTEKYADAIIKLKFNKKVQYAYQLAKLMNMRFSELTEVKDADVITFVPLHPEDHKKRGFNQSQLIAEHLGSFLSIPCEELLKKTKKNQPQHKLKRKDREKNVRGVYESTDKEIIKGRKILLVDDIVTTGFTLAECCSILRESEAKDVFCVTFAVSRSKTT